MHAPVLDTICGTLPGPDERGQPTMRWTSSSSQMLVQFISDDQIGKVGFTAEFSTTITSTEVPDVQCKLWVVRNNDRNIFIIKYLYPLTCKLSKYNT